VGPDLSLTYANPQRLGSIELAGRAYFPLTLNVYVDEKKIHTESVSAGEFVLRCTVGAQAVRKIRITANHYTMPFPPIINSKISYRLNWCNFFDDLSFPIPIIG
jgi:nickel-dependent lactate racemase